VTVPAVATTLVFPVVSVAAGVPIVAVGSLCGGVKVTWIPGTGFIWLSKTCTTSGSANCVFTVVLWSSPDTTTISAGVPAVLMSEKLAFRFPRVAVTV
jgi:hypothetical protein